MLYKFRKESNSAKKDFLVLNGILFLVSFAVFTPLAMDISPRFFLLSAFIPFIFLGLIFETITKKLYLNYITPALIAVILVFSNGKEIINRFAELASADQENIKIENDLILKEKTRVTYEQEKSIAAYMIEKQKGNGYPILFYGEARYVPSLAYILDQKNILFNDRVNYKQIYRYANYFWVDFTKFDGRYGIGKKEKNYYDIIEVKNFGTLAVLKLIPKEDAITDDYKIFDDKESRSSGPRRYTWGEL
jgi:multisubunit Na+/H+ antiporter MnhE subunit